MSQVADCYSRTLFDLAQEQNNLETVEESLSIIRKAIESSQDFRLFLKNPLLSYDERSKILKALFEGRIPELLLKFLIFITYKGRLSFLNEIIQSFDSLYLIKTRQLRAYVKTALNVSDEEKALISKRLEEKFKQKTLVKWRVDPSLIGGFRIFAEGKIYDYSFKNQLDNFYQKLIQPI